MELIRDKTIEMSRFIRVVYQWCVVTPFPLLKHVQTQIIHSHHLRQLARFADYSIR